MCLGDIKLALQAGAFESRPTIETTNTRLLGASADRVGILISNPTANSLFLTFDESATAQQGIEIPPDALPFKLTLQDHGPLVQKPIWASFATAQGVVVIWETVFQGLWEQFGANRT